MSSWGFEVELHQVIVRVFVVEIIISGPDDTIIHRIIPRPEICIGIKFHNERKGFFMVYKEICKALGLRPLTPTQNEYEIFTIYGECLYSWNAADGTTPPIPCKWSVDHAKDFLVPELIIGPVADHPVGTQTRRRIAQNAKEIVANIMDHIQEHYPPREYRCTLTLECLLNVLKRTQQVNPPNTLLPEGFKFKALARSEFRNNPYIPKDQDLSRLFPQLTMSIDLTHFADPYIARVGDLFYTLYVATSPNTPAYRRQAACELSILAFSSDLVQQCVRYAAEHFPMTGPRAIAQPQSGHSWTKGAIGLACFSVFNLCYGVSDPAGSSPKNLWLLMPKTSIVTILVGIAQHDPGYYASLFYSAFLIVQKTDLSPTFASILRTTCTDLGVLTAVDEVNGCFLNDTFAQSRINKWLQMLRYTMTGFPPFLPDFEPKQGQFSRHLLIGLLGLAWQSAFDLFEPELQRALLAAYPTTVPRINEIAAIIHAEWFPVADSVFHVSRLNIRTPGAGDGRPKFEFRALAIMTNVTEWKRLVSALVPVAEAMTIPSQWVLDQDRARRPQTPDRLPPDSASIDSELGVFPAGWPFVPEELPPGTPRAGPAAGPPGTPRAEPAAGPPGTPRAEPAAAPRGTPRAGPAAGRPGTARARSSRPPRPSGSGSDDSD